MHYNAGRHLQLSGLVALVDEYGNDRFGWGTEHENTYSATIHPTPMFGPSTKSTMW